jgi:hypothetical protein
MRPVESLANFNAPADPAQMPGCHQRIATIVSLSNECHAVARAGMKLAHHLRNPEASLLHEIFRPGARFKGRTLDLQHLGESEDHQVKNDFTRS